MNRNENKYVSQAGNKLEMNRNEMKTQGMN